MAMLSREFSQAFTESLNEYLREERRCVTSVDPFPGQKQTYVRVAPYTTTLEGEFPMAKLTEVKDPVDQQKLTFDVAISVVASDATWFYETLAEIEKRAQNVSVSRVLHSTTFTEVQLVPETEED